MPRSRHSEDGFTLIELLVIIGTSPPSPLPPSERGTYSVTAAGLIAEEGAVSQAIDWPSPARATPSA